jgi:predicted nucleotidyltransferase
MTDVVDTERFTQVFAGTPVVFAYLFGSRVTGSSRPDSDADVAVLLDDSVTATRHLDVRLELSRRLEPVLGAEVDVVVLNDVRLAVAGRVVQQRRVLYSRDEPARVQFESRVMKEYLDFRIHQLPLARQMLEQIAAGER